MTAAVGAIVQRARGFDPVLMTTIGLLIAITIASRMRWGNSDSVDSLYV